MCPLPRAALLSGAAEARRERVAVCADPNNLRVPTSAARFETRIVEILADELKAQSPTPVAQRRGFAAKDRCRRAHRLQAS